MLLSANLSSAVRKAFLPWSVVISALPMSSIQRRGLVAVLIPELARKIAPMGRRSFQFIWKGYFFAYRARTSPDRSCTRAPAGPKRRETLNVLEAPGLRSWQVIMNG